MVHIVETEWHPGCIAHTTVYISASPCVFDKMSNFLSHIASLSSRPLEVGLYFYSISGTEEVRLAGLQIIVISLAVIFCTH